MLLVISQLYRAAILLAFLVGLHGPRPYVLLYILTALIVLVSHGRGDGTTMPGQGWSQSPTLALWTGLPLVLFSIAYVVGMWHWKIWEWPTNILDGVNGLLLPTLMVAAGLRAAVLPRIWSSRLLLAYGLGSLIYLLAALAVSRQPWWDWNAVFPLTMHAAWGHEGEMNVRSMEQNAYPSLLLLAPALLIWLQKPAPRPALLAMAFVGASLLGAHSVWSLNGRLGWLALALSLLPVGLLAGGVLVARLGKGMAIGMALFMLTLSSIGVWQWSRSDMGPQTAGIWNQGFCDERFGMFAAMLARLAAAPWGGRALEVPYQSCVAGQPLMLSRSGGSIDMVHNVILEIYFTVGAPATLLLLFALTPLLIRACWGFWTSFPAWDWQSLLRWSWLCLLICQWMFQPLLYADGVLYYLSFFVLALLAAETHPSRPGWRPRRPWPPRSGP